MPESRRRKKDDYVPVKVSQTPVKLESPRWIVPAMVFFLVVGLFWIVAFYVAGSSIPVMKDLGNLVNVGIGFGLMAVGFFFLHKVAIITRV